ncbi:hypothetical protein [Neorhizobium huautlense]|uniref:hypothetical protein n=1 Tax=Neorhizobium huautlense TaxID=67774 RepID=UPI0013007C1F|nr:hypothetical protein [Neorhizobium huautlense]
MNSISVANIANRAKGLESGPISPEEVELARNILRGRDGGVVDAIQIVGLCGGASDAPLLEAYLHGEENNVYAEYAIKALCRYLGLVERYRPLLRQWMKNKDDGFRRMPAIHLAKEYFRDFEDKELGRYLIDVLCDMEDGCRSAVRGAFVDIFKLKDRLGDPFGLYFDDWDKDTTLIVNVAASEFGHPGPTVLHGRAGH